MSESFPVGTRVRLDANVAPGIKELEEEGTVERSDARGVLVRFASGMTVLCPPDALVRIPPPPG